MTTNVSLTGLARELKAHAEQGEQIRIGLIGCGEMGTDIVTAATRMDGIVVAAIADVRPEVATRAVEIAYQSHGHSAVVSGTDKLNAAIERGVVAVVDDAAVMLDSELIDVVVEATGLPGVGADFAVAAMERSKHLVMMNVEADVTLGSYLKSQADRHGVVYTLGAGDEPSSCMELIEFVSAMGHKIVCAGKGKNNPLNIDAVPEAYEQEAQQRNMNPRMLVEFVDGSKTMVEMAAIANATGLIPDKAGMHGPAAGVDDLASVLVPAEHGGVLSGAGRVDYSVGSGLAPGVFVVAEMRHPRISERMADLKLGSGPYHTFIRPYHLTSLEVPLSCARAVLHGKADMVPLPKPAAEVCAVAKRDLAVGETLDQIGEYCYRAWVMDYHSARSKGAVPCGILAGAKVTKSVKKGELLTSDSIAPDNDTRIVQLRKLQDSMVAEGALV